MEGWNPDNNPYHVLDLKAGASSSEIKKKYRKLVLIKHPDKQPGNKQAAEDFIKIQRAYEILTDDRARAAWEGLQRAKDAQEAKVAGQSEKRQKMARDLEERERKYSKERGEENLARRKLQEELSRLRQEMAEKERRKAAEMQARAMQERLAKSFTGAQTSTEQHQDSQANERTLKVSWDSTAGTYSDDQLREIFSTHGQVEELISRPGKKGNKASVLILMADRQGARNAILSANGDLDNPLKVLPLLKEMGLNVAPGGMQPVVQASPMIQVDVHTTGNPVLRQTPEDNAASQQNGVHPERPQGQHKPLFPVANSQRLGSRPLGAPARPLFAAGSRPSHLAGNDGVGSSQYMSSESALLEKMRKRAEEDRARNAK